MSEKGHLNRVAFSFLPFLRPLIQPATIDVKAMIERAMRPLVGLDLISMARSAECQWFTFGQHRDAEAIEVELAPFALHVSCPWRLLGDGQVLAGSTDHRRPADEDASEEEEDADPHWASTGSRWRSTGSDWRLTGTDWIDVREPCLRELLQQTRHSISSIEVDDSGWFRLGVSHQLVLEVFPDASRADHDEVEFWRLFQPGLDYSHFVVSSNGADRV